MNLSSVRTTIKDHLEKLRDLDGPTGDYRSGIGLSTDLYSSLDIALMRRLMGENLQATLTPTERQEWAGHINSFQKPDGTFTGIFTHHSQLHAHGMVIGALGVLGHRMRYTHSLYAPFADIGKIDPWLNKIDWAEQWSASHLFWGGMHCYSMSRGCSPAWRDAVFNWLDDHLDKNTGWWIKGTTYTNRHEPLGGSVHILPIYQHHQRHFPAARALIDSVLAMQLPNTRWLDQPDDYPLSYLELDALYALKFAGNLEPQYRSEDILNAVRRFGLTVEQAWDRDHEKLLAPHPHIILGLVGTFGLLQQHLPEEYTDSVEWTDIFSDIRLYQTDATTAI